MAERTTTNTRQEKAVKLPELRPVHDPALDYKNRKSKGAVSEKEVEWLIERAEADIADPDPEAIDRVQDDYERYLDRINYDDR